MLSEQGEVHEVAQLQQHTKSMVQASCFKGDSKDSNSEVYSKTLEVTREVNQEAVCRAVYSYTIAVRE